jgi:cytochrome c-type biogenesis protein CcmH
MLLALLLGGVTVIVLAMVLGPLMKPARAPVERAAFDRAVYRDQLQELEREVSRGLVEPGQAAPARIELQRRLLSSEGSAAPAQAGSRLPVVAAVVATAVVMISGAIYLRVGAPGFPAEPYAARGAERAQAAAAQAEMAQIKGMVARLAAKLKAQPNDLDGWLRLGRSYAVLGEHDKADEAFAAAERLKPNDLSVLLPEADAMMIGHGPTDPISDRVVALLTRILALDPKQPAALWYLGLHAAEQHDFAAARAKWQALLAALPADSKERHTVEAALDAIKGR